MYANAKYKDVLPVGQVLEGEAVPGLGATREKLEHHHARPCPSEHSAKDHDELRRCGRRGEIPQRVPGSAEGCGRAESPPNRPGGEATSGRQAGAGISSRAARAVRECAEGED